MTETLILVRWVHFATSLLAAGTVTFAVLVAQPAAAMSGTKIATLFRRLRLLTWSALALAFVSGAVWLALLAADIVGTSVLDACLHGGVLSVLTETRFGTVWSVRLALTVILALLFPWPRSGPLQVAAAAGLAALLAWVGHAGASTGTVGGLQVSVDVVHLLAAAAWLGGLPAFALMLAWAHKAGTHGGFPAHATARFSRLGMVSVAALLASGIVNSWFLLSGPRDLWTTDYGRLVLLKVLLFATMLGIAAVNRLRLTPRLPGAQALRALQRNSLVETALGVVVLLAVGALGTMSPTKHIHAAAGGVAADAAFVHIHTSEAMADVTIDPGKTGDADVTIRVSREDFTELPVKSVRLALDPPGNNGASTEREATHTDDGTWKIEAFAIGKSGVWTARVIVAPQTGLPIVLDAPVVIEP